MWASAVAQFFSKNSIRKKRKKNSLAHKVLDRFNIYVDYMEVDLTNKELSFWFY